MSQPLLVLIQDCNLNLTAMLYFESYKADLEKSCARGCMGVLFLIEVLH